MMELQYIILTIIKILISVPAVLLIVDHAHGAALIGGHLNNQNSSGTPTGLQSGGGSQKAKNISSAYEFKIEVGDSQEEDVTTTEAIPNPSPLVVPGYNLPENIFNKGKPFYLEKDPLTGSVDFSKTKLYDEYEYEDDESALPFDKSSIDRKDGPISGSHKPSDINQLTPNFHDFLNLPVKYNPDKYVYPLISSSYANTKVQGNVNKHLNHKNYVVTTYKPTFSPTYFSTKKIFVPNKVIEFTTARTTTTSEKPMIYLTTSRENLMNSPMNHPSFTDRKPTKRPISLFEQLFGDYDDSASGEMTTTTTTNAPTTTTTTTTTTTMPTTTTRQYYMSTNSYKPSNPFIINEESTKSSMEYEEYEYDDTLTTSTTPTTPKMIYTTASTTTTPATYTDRVTSLPLGENHVNNRIIVATPNLREQLNGEKVAKTPPSTSNIHIAPDQDTVSFVVGNHQNVEGSVGYDSNPFRPVQHNDRINMKGQVVDDQLDEVEFKGAKIVFPTDEKTTINYAPTDLSPPPQLQLPNREVLKLNSKPMFHQLPSDLTPPQKERVRPPWDPRPGHFHQGRPEYARPPRPQEVYKRIDNLPNILPQFRPNMLNTKHQYNHQHQHQHQRQPLLDRPASNRPIGFFEKLQPPPLPTPAKIVRKHVTDKTVANSHEHFSFQPPKIIVNNRRSDPETLQMIQAKQEKEINKNSFQTNLNGKDNIEKPLYVVYPVNATPLKLDNTEGNKKETVVIGTRAELPLPPSKIQDEFKYEVKERHDSPILKPRPVTFPIKSDFPYPLERPTTTLSTSNIDNVIENKLPDEPTVFSSNQWNTIEDANVKTPPRNHNNQISVTLKTYTEKPIAVAYTPTESTSNKQQDPKFSMPNYASLVIPEIRDSEITVGAVMHAHHHQHQHPQHTQQHHQVKQDRIDDSTMVVPSHDFQAPFQASAHIDHSVSQGWTVVRDSDDHNKEESTTLPIVTTSEFDIENFKPQLEGGFKPIYNYPDDKKDVVVNERQE